MSPIPGGCLPAPPLALPGRYGAPPARPMLLAQGAFGWGVPAPALGMTVKTLGPTLPCGAASWPPLRMACVALSGPKPAAVADLAWLGTVDLGVCALISASLRQRPALARLPAHLPPA